MPPNMIGAYMVDNVLKLQQGDRFVKGGVNTSVYRLQELKPEEKVEADHVIKKPVSPWVVRYLPAMWMHSIASIRKSRTLTQRMVLGCWLKTEKKCMEPKDGVCKWLYNSRKRSMCMTKSLDNGIKVTGLKPDYLMTRLP